MEHRGFVFHTENLLSPDDAVATFLARVPLAPLGVEEVALDDAFGRVLARRALADSDYPNAPRSAMDGFAVAAASAPGTLRIAGDIAMGAVWPERLARGEALRIPTGGVVPNGADAVVPIEDVRIDGDRIVVDGVVAPGENINERAGDMRAGEPVLEAGIVVNAPQIGVLATLGITRVSVYRRPRVAVISSGDELIDPARRPEPGQIRDSNRYAIAAALRALGADARHEPTVPDEDGALEAALRAALVECDGAVVTGGSSVGERDRTPGAIAALGEPGVIVHGLRVKPGKPTVFAAASGKPVIGLPGNPTSALLILEAVVAPIVRALTGAPHAPVTASARLASALRSRAGWTWYVPVALQHEGGEAVAHPLPLRSSMVSLTARADGYVIVPEAVEEIAAGTVVAAHRFL